jgi:hypothetical protein
MANTKQMLVPQLGQLAHFTDREAMRNGHPVRRYKLYNGATNHALPAATLPIDWTKGDSLPFLMYGNDRLGDCMYAAGAHADNTFTGNASVESTFDEATLEKDYLALSGGDNGLDEGQLVGEWKKGLCSNPAASILDALDVDPTDAPLVQSALELFGGVLFMLAVPDAWVNNFRTGAVWDAPARANPQNGHGIWWNGVDAAGRYKLQTWGTHGWITPAGVAVCDPSAFVVFSLRWFNSKGIAPNGLSYDQLAAYWVQAGGKTLPPWSGPINPPPPPPPPAGGVTLAQAQGWAVGALKAMHNTFGYVRQSQAELVVAAGLAKHWPA